MERAEREVMGHEDTMSQASPSVHRYSHALISREIIQDSKIPLDARMLLVYLLSFKEGWNFYDSKIRDDLDIGFAKLKSLFKQLRDLGYIKTVYITGENGQKKGSKRLFSALAEFRKESSTSTDSTESMKTRQSVKPTARKSEPKITNSIIKDDIYINSKIDKKSFENEFEQFWSISPKKVDKQKSLQIFNKLLAEDYGNFEKIMAARRAQNVVIEFYGTEQRFIKGPDSWLRNRRFEDEVLTQEQLHEERNRFTRVRNQHNVQNGYQSNNSRGQSKIEARNNLLRKLREDAYEEAARAFSGPEECHTQC